MTLLSIVLLLRSLSSSTPSISFVSFSIPFCRLLVFQRVSSAFSFVQSAVFLLSSSSASATLILEVEFYSENFSAYAEVMQDVWC